LQYVILVIKIFIYCNCLSPGGSGYFACKQNMKLVTTKFKSGGLHEKHVVATWNLTTWNFTIKTLNLRVVIKNCPLIQGNKH